MRTALRRAAIVAAATAVAGLAYAAPASAKDEPRNDTEVSADLTAAINLQLGRDAHAPLCRTGAPRLLHTADDASVLLCLTVDVDADVDVDVDADTAVAVLVD